MSTTAEQVLNKARADIGYYRHDDPLNGTKYGRYFANDLGWGSYYGANGVPFCAMAVSCWHIWAGGDSFPSIPGAYTPSMVNQGRAAGLEVNKYDAKPGDHVYFDWELDGVVDHVGLVEYNNGSYLTTIEGNTNGGRVARRTRSFGTIVCVIRPPYSGSSSGGGSGTPSTPSATGSDLVKTAQSYLKRWGYDLGSSGVDGSCGPDTIKAAVKYVQYNMNYYGARLAVDGDIGPATKAAWEKYGYVKLYCPRIYMVKAVQIALMLHGVSVGPSGIDGSCGPDTDTAIRTFQSNKGLESDGSVGPATFPVLFSI